jgi:DNA-binding GntR family transcriptional regulator
VLSLTEVLATPEVAERLQCAPGTEVIELVRLRSADDKPIAKMTNYLPVAVMRFSEEELATRGLYELIRSQGITLHSAVQTVGARTAVPAESKLLEEPRGAALLTMERITYDDHGKVVEYGSHVYAASRYSFEISLLTA